MPQNPIAVVLSIMTCLRSVVKLNTNVQNVVTKRKCITGTTPYLRTLPTTTKNSTMVKNNTFNGINLPDIVLRHEDGREETLRTFGYDDFASRL